MATNKYIGTKDVARLTGLTIQEVYELIHSGKLPARKAPKSGWRISQDDVEALGLIPESPYRAPDITQVAQCVTFIADEEHYTQVFKRMTEVKHSLKIATANLKNFYVTIEDNDGDETLRLCEFFLSLVERGVHVQVVCMKPYGFYNYTKINCPQLLDNPLFELRYNGCNHMKVFIFDDEVAYLGSANITDAALGRRANGGRNHEMGMLVKGQMMQAPLHHFESVWNDPDIFKHTWKRFAAEAKKWEKRYEE